MDNFRILSESDIEHECIKNKIAKTVHSYRSAIKPYSRQIIELPRRDNEKWRWYLECDITLTRDHIYPAFTNIYPLFKLLSSIDTPVKITYYAECQINEDITARFIWGTTSSREDVYIDYDDNDTLTPASLNFMEDTRFYKTLCIYPTKKTKKIEYWFGESYAHGDIMRCRTLFLYNKPSPPHDIIYLEKLKSPNIEEKSPYIFNIKIDQQGLYILPNEDQQEFLEIFSETYKEFATKKSTEDEFLDCVKRQWYRYFTDTRIKTITARLWDNINKVYTNRGAICV